MLSGCFICNEERTRSGVSALNGNIQMWDAASIESYVLVYSIYGGLLPPALIRTNRIVVSSGQISQVEVLDSNGNLVELVSADGYSDYFTVEGLFDEIVELNSTVKGLSVQYDQLYGVPSTIAVDPNIDVDGCGDVSDDEYTISAAVEI